MKRKKLALIVGLFFIGNSQTVFAENFNDVCSNTIEGANIAMSKEEVQSTWQHAGFENSKHKQKKHKLSKQPESIQSLLFQTEDRQPNENFVKLLGWKQILSNDNRRIFANYVAPKDPSRIEAYETFYRAKLTAFCEYNIETLRETEPAVRATRASRMNPNPKSAVHEFCENALKGEFRTDSNGHAHPPPHSLNITNAQGCRVSISNLNLRGYKAAFTVSIENNQ